MVSDNNSLVVSHVLDRLRLSPLVDAVLTNPARVGEDGKISVEPHQRQEECSRSFTNLCKTKVFITDCIY